MVGFGLFLSLTCPRKGKEMAKKVNIIGAQPKRVRMVDQPQRRIDPAELAAALGAEPCGERLSGRFDPISLAEIGNELLKRRRSSGGRPSLADASERCKVPLSKEDVAALEEIVAAIERATGSKPALGEIASVILRMHFDARKNGVREAGPELQQTTAAAPVIEEGQQQQDGGTVSLSVCKRLIEEQLQPIREELDRLAKEVRANSTSASGGT